MSTSSNASTQQMIDRVVREVLARLGSAGSTASTSSRPAASQEGKEQERESRCFSIADRVLSVESLAAVPAGVDRVQIQPATVITPAARDIARERGIIWIRQGESPQAERGVLLIADTDSPARSSGLRHQLATRGLLATSTDPDSLLKRIGQDPATGLVLSDLPAGFVCKACRNEAVRAAAVSELNELSAIAAQMKPNLWVIDMRRVSLSKAIVLAERCIRQQGVTP